MNEEQRPKPTEDWAFCCLKESQVTRLLQADLTSVTRCIGKPSQTVLSCSFKDHLCFCEHVAHFHRAGFPQAKSSTCRITAETLPPWTSTVAHQQKPAWGLAASLQRPWG